MSTYFAFDSKFKFLSNWDLNLIDRDLYFFKDI